MKILEDARDLHVAEFKRVGAGLPGRAELRRRAIDRFAESGFPTDRREEWRFTDVTPIAETAFKPARGTANPNQFSALARGPLKDCQITFVDGRHAPAFSSPDLPKGIRVESIANALDSDRLGSLASIDANPFTALNTAFMADGAIVEIPAGVEVDRPIHLLFLSSLHGEPYVTHPRILVVMGENSGATIVESFLGPAGGTYFTNAVTEVFLEDGARLSYTKVQRESLEAFHVAAFQARQGRSSTLTHHSISLGAALARNDFGTVLNGEGAECTLNGLYEVAGSQHVDHHTMIDHAVPHGHSSELYKGILGGRARAVFDGRILVRKDAQKTRAEQTNRNLILSKEALVHTKPQLEIFADDVKCRHGATIGQLDEDVLFYLRSRGIGLEDARRLLVHAFASEIVDGVRTDAVRSQLGGCLGMMVAGAGA